MTDCRCLACGGRVELAFRSKDYNRRISDEVFSYFKCAACGCIFLSPLPADLGRYYPDEYYDVPKSLHELDARAEATQRSKLDVVNKFAKTGQLLEIGPAYGLFAHLAKKNGFDVTAIEMSSKSCVFLRDTVKIKVVEDADTMRALSTVSRQDVIVLWQVLEHLPDPFAVLAATAERLKPGGILVVDMPNPDSLQFRLLGSRWTHLDAPRHVALIPPALLAAAAGRLGLSLLFQSSNTAISRGYNSFGWAYSMKALFTGERLGRVAFHCGRLIAKMLAPLERTSDRGSTYTAVFSKKGAP